MILGDANLDMNKWNDPKYKNAKVTHVLRECLDSNGLKIEDIGNTYIANHTQKNGNIFRVWTHPSFLFGDLGTFALFELPMFLYGTFI